MTDYESIILGIINCIAGTTILIFKWGEWFYCIVGLFFLIYGGSLLWKGIKE